MNKYRDKSDFEINKAVADFYLTREYRFNSADKIVELMDIDLSCEFGGEINLKDKYVTGTFDPCNDPADAFPLIIDVKLSIHPDFYNNCESWIVRTVHIPPVKDKSLTRAICIAYLMMKDAENEKI